MSVAASQSEHLCVACGICCSGTLFNRAVVYEGEHERLLALGFSVTEVDGDRVFPLRCVQLSGTLCTVYPDRPLACRTYRCATLRAFEALEIDRPEADRRVVTTKAAIADLHVTLGDGSIAELKQQLTAGTPVAPELKLQLGIVELLLGRYFKLPDDHPDSGVTDLARA